MDTGPFKNSNFVKLFDYEGTTLSIRHYYPQYCEDDDKGSKALIIFG